MAFDIQDYLKNNKIELGSVKKEVGDTPYKGGHNDIRKTNYDVKIKEDGKLDLYTHKTIVTENKNLIKEASEIKFDELDTDDKQLATSLQKHFGAKINTIWDGIHGKIVELEVKGGHGAYRFEKGDFQLLAKLRVRWMEADGNIISIAF